MKQFLSLFTLLLFALNGFSQTVNTIEKYPKVYTVEMADSLIKLKDYQKAAWYIVNIYSIDKPLARRKILELQGKVDDLPRFIRSAFAIYGVLDPEISSGMGNLNGEKLQEKGAWGDALIYYVMDPKSTELDPSNEKLLQAVVFPKAKTGPLSYADSLLVKCNMELRPLKGMDEVELEFMHKIPHHIAFDNKAEKYQVRYYFSPLDKMIESYNESIKRKSQHMKPNDLCKSMIRIVVLNASNNETSDHQVVNPQLFTNADWEATASVNVGYKSVNYKYCYIISLHRDNMADAYIYILSDDKNKLSKLSSQLSSTLKFIK
jgi:hypothetical protein